ncbi:FMN-binding negative transcriptional regulator [Pseudarthrobacter sp. SL88]|uniref:FMN-binding negative transcriptional regulator n=1 Tax=Micrococcaceae TaxID=1268 RepID=UPI0006FDC05F|nr:MULTISPECIES: FMN-binding negative transcriptional regulator [Micrococcaceae]KQQ82731.1 transcriptional regulator [Arthrobacter sp. Leaf137]MCT9625833.1 FMN-binding negative transcriptional regulator [Pseudarthrobacter equi]MCY1675555.1 FMN-binding negative transcriptional regulator [Pseudarthrobacter sp. SL88]
MYIPAHFAAGPDAVRHLLATPGAGNLITMTDGGLLATLLPFVYEPNVGEHGALHAHVARNNPQASAAVAGEALAIIQGPDAYISPSWYASKAEHGRVVPTWNYSTAHVYGQLVVHDDAGWLARHVRRLTDRHEGEREHPWSVGDAPEKFIAGQLRAIVGIELLITRIEAKEKLSQNRSAADAAGVVAGLRSSGQEASAAAVERVLAQRTPES